MSEAGPAGAATASAGVGDAAGSAPAAAAAPNVEALLAEARANGVDRLDAHSLLARAFGRSRSWLIAHDDAELAPAAAEVVRALVARRAAGEPLAYLLGEKEFHGLLLEVGPDVLVPRPDTELLVDWALELLTNDLAHVTAPHVADLGTGSGAVAIAVKHRHPAASVFASDNSEAALAVARRNARRFGLALQWRHGSWWSAFGADRFHLVLANPPYIAADDPHLAALRHEPTAALTPGGDGLPALRAIVTDAPAHLHDGGFVVVEHGFDQGPAVRQLFGARGFRPAVTRRDAAGRERCTGAAWR